MSLVPFVCAELPEEWRLSVLTSGIVLEFFAGAILYFAPHDGKPGAETIVCG